jgi:hypothetical protein
VSWASGEPAQYEFAPSRRKLYPFRIPLSEECGPPHSTCRFGGEWNTHALRVVGREDTKTVSHRLLIRRGLCGFVLGVFDGFCLQRPSNGWRGGRSRTCAREADLGILLLTQREGVANDCIVPQHRRYIGGSRGYGHGIRRMADGAGTMAPTYMVTLSARLKVPPRADIAF